MIKGGDLVECLQSCRPSHTFNKSLRREAAVIGVAFLSSPSMVYLFSLTNYLGGSGCPINLGSCNYFNVG